jgi:hypothetical protein
MARVYGKLTDFGLDPIDTYRPRVIFTPSRVGTFSDRLMITRPRTAVPTEDGSFAVDLVPTPRIRPLVHYNVKVTWLDPNAGFERVDQVLAPMSVPEDGGSISDLLSLPADNPSLWAFQPDEPDPWSVGLVWVNTESGDIRKRTA